METNRRSLAAWRSARELCIALVDCILPPHCCACGERLSERIGAGRVCRQCLALLEPLPEIGCVRCGEPIRIQSGSTGRCGEDHSALVGLAFAAAAYRYRGAGGALVRRLKLEGDFAALKALAAAMARTVCPRLDGAFVRPTVVSVPLHRARRRQRGYDQAQLLATEVGRRLRLPVLPAALSRQRATIPQGDARVLSREQNVAGAFVVERPAHVAGKPILLVDDVMTSGATARECAARLREAGATSVALLTACRAWNPHS
jgi:ComF family protein